MRLSSVCLTALLWVAGPQIAAAAIETAKCRLTRPHLPTASAECGTLSVPENPDDPGGRQIALFVAIVPALSQTPRPDPLVLINGGPGGATTDLYLQLRPAFEPIRRERDIIIV
ncbi:MAG TPA: alpha/beta hydrolase, partial [Gammaproteobacteria bacterium]